MVLDLSVFYFQGSGRRGIHFLVSGEQVGNEVLR